MTRPSGWTLEHHRGRASTFHDRSVPGGIGRSVWWFEVEQPTVVLGSTQRDDVVDRVRLERSGADVARRRSGGGAVWLAPGEVTWVDLVIPNGDPLWDDDVNRSSRWVAEAWARCLGASGVRGAEPHGGAMVDGGWAGLVCFGGLAPGEVTIDGRKVLGVSQRRTREAARFQCVLVHRWDPVPLLDVLALDDPDRRRAATDLADAGGGVGPFDGSTVVEHLLAALPE